MLYERQKQLLALVNVLGGEVGGLDFQKLLLLYCLEVEESPSYEFVPYKFGGFSFTSYADKRRLIGKGLLADESRAWKLTPAGKTVTIQRIPIDGDGRFAKCHQGCREMSLWPRFIGGIPTLLFEVRLRNYCRRGCRRAKCDLSRPPRKAQSRSLHHRL